MCSSPVTRDMTCAAPFRGGLFGALRGLRPRPPRFRSAVPLRAPAATSAYANGYNSYLSHSMRSHGDLSREMNGDGHGHRRKVRAWAHSPTRGCPGGASLAVRSPLMVKALQDTCLDHSARSARAPSAPSATSSGAWRSRWPRAWPSGVSWCGAISICQRRIARASPSCPAS